MYTTHAFPEYFGFIYMTRIHFMCDIQTLLAIKMIIIHWLKHISQTVGQ